MASCARYPFRPQLLKAAERLEHARSVEEFRAAVFANRRLWTTLERAIASNPSLLPCLEAGQVHRDARYVLDLTEGARLPHDRDIEAFIAINRQTADRMAALSVKAPPVWEAAE